MFVVRTSAHANSLEFGEGEDLAACLIDAIKHCNTIHESAQSGYEYTQQRQETHTAPQARRDVALMQRRAEVHQNPSVRTAVRSPGAILVNSAAFPAAIRLPIVLCGHVQHDVHHEPSATADDAIHKACIDVGACAIDAPCPRRRLVHTHQ